MGTRSGVKFKFTPSQMGQSSYKQDKIPGQKHCGKLKRRTTRLLDESIVSKKAKGNLKVTNNSNANKSDNDDTMETVDKAQMAKQTTTLAPVMRPDETRKTFLLAPIREIEFKIPTLEISTSNIDLPPLPSPTASDTNAKGMGNAKRDNGYIHLETWFAPKDYDNIVCTTAACHNQLLSILQSFHSSSGMKVMNWQTKIALPNKLDLVNVNLILSIKITNSKKEKAFYFSFRIKATGLKFTKALQSAEFINIKKMARINFETSNVGTQRGDVTAIGNILCKDAALKPNS